MEELRPEELEELVQELEGESDEEEALSPDVEELLRDLEQARSWWTRKSAAERLGELSESSPRIVQSLITVRESDSFYGVREAAVASLRALVHQECLQQHPELMEAAVSVQQQRKLLSPSELILLHGDKFTRDLGQKMLAAAFLANEQAGAVRLGVRQQQAKLGLLNQDKLFVVPGEGAIAWPSRSFESALHQIAASLQSESGKGQNHVSEIVYDWWMRREGRKSSSPWATLGRLVKDGLAYRGLLQEERKSGLKGFLAGTSYVLPAETAAMVTQQSLEPIEQLLETCRRTRPQVWDLLIEGINKGIGKCTESDPDPW